MCTDGQCVLENLEEERYKEFIREFISLGDEDARKGDRLDRYSKLLSSMEMGTGK